MLRESLDAPEDLPKQALRQVAFGQLFCVVKNGTLKDWADCVRLPASKSFVLGDTEVAAPLAKSRPEPNAAAGVGPPGGDRRAEGHAASRSGDHRRELLGGRPAA
jgi:hypothetical protein